MHHGSTSGSGFASRTARATLGLLLAVVAAASVACSTADTAPGTGWAGTIDTLANGAVVVRNPDVPTWDSAATWRIREELRLGSLDEEGPELFGQIADVAVDAAGRIYVLESQAQEIRVFTPEGAHLRTIGRKGGGPGEFADAVALRMRPGGTEFWVVDYGNARYARFDTAGRQLDVMRRPFGFRAYPWRGVVDTAGQLLEQNIAYAGDIAEPLDVLVGFGADGAPADTAYLPRFEPESFTATTAQGRPMFSMPVPFTPQQVLLFDPRRRIWSATTGRYALVQQTLAGDTVRVVELQRQPRPVTDAEAAEAFDGIAERMAEIGGRGGRAPTVDRSRLGRSHPVLAEPFLDDAGYLWVRPDLETPPKGGPTGSTFDVFDPEGRYLGQVRSDVAIVGWMVRPRIVGDRLYAITRDTTTDVAYVVRARIEGRAEGAGLPGAR